MIYINLRFVNINIKKIIYLTVTNLKRIHMKRITVLFFFLLSVYFSYGQEITIGTGSITQEYPLSNYYGYQRSAALYTAAEINQTGFINKLAWDIGKMGDSRPVKIYLKAVEVDTLVAANWSTLTTGATLVYNGSFIPKNTTGYRTINLDRSFNYVGGTKSVLVLVETNAGGAGIDEAEGLLIKASASTNRHLTTRVDNTSASGNLSFVSSRPNIKMIFGPEITCYGIHAVIDTVKAKSISFSITSQTTTTSFSYEIRTSGNPGSGATGLAASGTITNMSVQPFVVRGLTQLTDYTLYVRANCANSQNSLYSEGLDFSTPLDIVQLPFTENFEDETHFYYVNDTNNKWYVGNAVNNGGTKALYISKDAGVTNTYNNVGVQVSHAYMNVEIPEGAEDLEITFDWRCLGQTGLKDYFRVWLVPMTYTPTVRSQITANATRIQIGREQYYDNAVFLNERAFIHVAPFAGQQMRIVFEWKQDSSGGEDPPAAIDNLNIKPYFCKKVASNTIQVSNITTTEGTVSWTSTTAQSYEVYLTEAPQAPASVIPPIGSNGILASTDTTTHTFINLKPGTQYLVWVRAKCEPNKLSVWDGPKILATDMTLEELPYSENFEGVTNFEYKKNDSKNKWFVGSAVNNGGSKALYISENYGLTNTYNVTGIQVSHVYKDFKIPAGTQEVKVNFDWRCVGEGTISDYFRVWVVPQNYTPSVGTQIAVGTNRIRLGSAQFNGRDTFKSEEIIFDATAYAGQNVRLVFEWRQDNAGGNQPPVAIDNLKVEAKSCVAPTNFRVIETRGTTAKVAWTRVPRQNKFEIYYSTVNTPPGETVTGSIITTQNPYTITGLSARTTYYVWIRTVCGDNNRSFWVRLTFNTGQIPADMPYNEDFEDVSDWDFQSSALNKWVIGTAVNNGGDKSLYVTKDEGATNSYDITVATVAHAYRDIAVPMGTAESNLSFDWRCLGEGTTTKRDYFKVWLVPNTFTPIVGQQITAADDRIQVGGMFNQQETFTNYIIQNIDLIQFQGRVMRLVFEWRQDANGGDQPPGAIDNIRIEKGVCPKVRNLQAEAIENASPQSALLTWDSFGDETQWEVIIFELEDPTVPNNTTPGGIIVNQTSYVFRDPDPTNPAPRFYKFYVRPVCGGDGTEKKWTGPAVISFIPPPGCAKVKADIEFTELEGLVQNEKGEYVICDKGAFDFTLGAAYYDIKKTDKYKVEPIEYKPPFPFKGGGAIQLNQDDIWSGVIDLGFEFCFYGNQYRNILINTNGTISFSIRGVVPGGVYTPGATGAPYNPTTLVPSNPGGTSGPTLNSIMGVFQDTHPGAGQAPPDRSINYQIMGKAPCRTLVFNVYRLGMFGGGNGCAYDPADVEGTTQTSQIVMYEGSNIIEVYVKNRHANCGSWDGNAIIGLQNADATQGITPPERNTGRWTAQNEAWRFTPDGDSTAEFLWEKDDEFLSTNAEIQVKIDKTVKYTAKAIYQICGEEETVMTKEFIFLKEDFEIGQVKDLIQCTKKPGEENIFDLRDAYPDIYGNLDPTRYVLKFYETEEDRAADRASLPDIVKYKGSNKPIFIKLTNKLTGCIEYKSFRLTVDKPLPVTILEDKSVCGSYLLPKLAEGEAYYTKPYGEGIKYEGGAIFSEIGIHDIYVYKVDEKGCFGQSQFVLEVVEQIVADRIANMVLKCEVYSLPALSEHNKYYTLPNGEGKELPAGTIIYEPTTIYIFATLEGEKGAVCVDQSSFTIDFEECPIPKGISPNGDGINDSLDLSGYGVSKIQIFNRYGMEVYSQGLYQSEWKGQDKSGNKLPSGTYFYVIVANGEMKSGWIQLSY
ncbi:gliding motility-associated-like protein [Myroides gitamensis]|nr:gliding motility-associated-like protein [Myroides gitamensis]